MFLHIHVLTKYLVYSYVSAYTCTYKVPCVFLCLCIYMYFQSTLCILMSLHIHVLAKYLVYSYVSAYICTYKVPCVFFVCTQLASCDWFSRVAHIIVAHAVYSPGSHDLRPSEMPSGVNGYYYSQTLSPVHTSCERKANVDVTWPVLQRMFTGVVHILTGPHSVLVQRAKSLNCT